jgi:murein DD-endopeptidase MepM/ murein hydrolase activator NlpD
MLGVSAASPAAAPAALEITVHARALVPGEPLRIVVTSAEPLQALGGRLLEHEATGVRDGSRADRWTIWTMIDLDRQPGPATIEVEGTTERGTRIDGTTAVTIAAKSFPEETLDVPERYVEPPASVRQRIERERARLAALYERHSPRAPAAPFVRPVPGAPTSTFGTRRVFNGTPRSPHPGLDLRAAVGTPVVASGGGRVVLAQDLYYSGNTVIVDHGCRLFTIYAHLSRIDVAPDEEVAAGDRVGLSGRTGRVTGPHLHWGAKIGDRPFDPTALLDAALFR